MGLDKQDIKLDAITSLAIKLLYKANEELGVFKG